MTRHLREDFEGQSLTVDGQDYDGCVFTDCDLIYRGGEVPELSNCIFIRCGWELADAALRTIDFLTVLQNSGVSEIVNKIWGMLGSIPELPDAPKGPIQ